MPKMIGMMRLGRDAEIRYTQAGEPVASLSLAFDYGKPGPDGKRQTQWVDGTLWGKRAESLAPYLTKGGLHCFTLDEAHIQTFQRQDGTEGIKLAARVIDVELAGRPSSQDSAPAQRPAQRQEAPRQQAQQRPAQRQAAPSGFDDMDSDIPF